MASPSPVRELVRDVPAPRGDHGKDETPAGTQQCLVNVRVEIGDLDGNVGDVELDRSTTTSLQVDEE